MDFSSINYLAVVVATIAAFALGALWYAPFLFGKAWQKENGFSDEDLKGSNMGKVFGLTFVLTFVMAFGLAMMFSHHPDEINWRSGMHHGLLVGVFFVAMSMGINYLYQRKSFRLWLIDSLYQVVFMGIIGAILGAWQ